MTRRMTWGALLLVAVVLCGCAAHYHQGRRYTRSIGPVGKTLIAVSTVALASLAVAANTQIGDDRTDKHNTIWGYTGLGAGTVAAVIGLSGAWVSKVPGTNWWDRSGWAWVTGIAAAAGEASAIAAIVRAARGAECCVVCTSGCACGGSCIDCSKTCNVGPGCACNQ